MCPKCIVIAMLASAVCTYYREPLELHEVIFSEPSVNTFGKSDDQMPVAEVMERSISLRGWRYQRLHIGFDNVPFVTVHSIYLRNQNVALGLTSTLELTGSAAFHS